MPLFHSAADKGLHHSVSLAVEASFVRRETESCATL